MLETVIHVILGLAAAAAIVVVLALRRPDTMRIVRQQEIAAAPEVIFPLINDLRGFSSWSPFEKDPSMTKVYSGPNHGPGQRMEWNGNSQVGEGSITILSSSASSRVDMALVFKRPMQGDNHVIFTLVPASGKTTVTWSIEGRTPLIAKVMGVFVDMDRMCGAEFDRGLANLKATVERPSAAAA